LLNQRKGKAEGGLVFGIAIAKSNYFEERG